MHLEYFTWAGAVVRRLELCVLGADLELGGCRVGVIFVPPCSTLLLAVPGSVSALVAKSKKKLRF